MPCYGTSHHLPSHDNLALSHDSLSLSHNLLQTAQQGRLLAAGPAEDGEQERDAL